MRASRGNRSVGGAETEKYSDDRDDRNAGRCGFVGICGAGGFHGDGCRRRHTRRCGVDSAGGNVTTRGSAAACARESPGYGRVR